MKRWAQTAAAVGTGYLLGRTKKMRLALMIAAAGATGRVGTGTDSLVRHGLRQLAEAADLGTVTDSVRTELVGAARAAATKAATSRIESLTDRIEAGGTTESGTDAEDQGEGGQEHDDDRDREDDGGQGHDGQADKDDQDVPDAEVDVPEQDTAGRDRTAEEPRSPQRTGQPDTGGDDDGSAGRRRPGRNRARESGERSAGTERTRTRARSAASRSPAQRTGR